MHTVQESEILEHPHQELQKLLKILEEGIDLYLCHEALHLRANPSSIEMVNGVLRVCLISWRLYLSGNVLEI